MNKKTSIRIIAYLSLVISLSLVIFGLAQVVSYFQSGADPASLLNTTEEENIERYQPVYNWDTTEYSGRKINKGLMKQITDDFLAGEFLTFQMLAENQLEGLEDYYTKHSRGNVSRLVEYQANKGISQQGTGIEHHFDLKLFSEDGSLVTFTDSTTRYIQTVDRDGITYSGYDTAIFDIMLLLEDNRWRIRHKVRRPAFQAITHGSPQKSPDDVLIKGVNYYPAGYPWKEFWKAFAVDTISQDLEIIRSLGANSVRIFVPYSDYRSEQEIGVLTERLVRFLDLAAQKELRVIVTLFDFFSGYSISDWTLSDHYLRTILKSAGDHPAVYAWDIKNEPDLDFDLYGKQKVMTWLEFVIARARIHAPEAAFTIGWSQPEFLNLHNDIVDIYSFHYFRDPHDLKIFLDSATFNKPLILEEFGMSTYNPIWYPPGKDEDDQYEYYQEMLALVREYGISYAFWTLHDFTEVPDYVAGSRPWRKGLQGSFGLIDSDGKRKRAFELIREFNSGL